MRSGFTQGQCPAALTLHPYLHLPDGTGWSDAPAEHNRPGGPPSYSGSSSRQVPNPPLHLGKLGSQACGNLLCMRSLAPVASGSAPRAAESTSGRGSASRGLGFRPPANTPVSTQSPVAPGCRTGILRLTEGDQGGRSLQACDSGGSAPLAAPPPLASTRGRGVGLQLRAAPTG